MIEVVQLDCQKQPLNAYRIWAASAARNGSLRNLSATLRQRQPQSPPKSAIIAMSAPDSCYGKSRVINPVWREAWEADMQPKTLKTLTDADFVRVKNHVRASLEIDQSIREEPSYATPLPLEVGFQLTNRCNLRCNTCF